MLFLVKQQEQPPCRQTNIADPHPLLFLCIYSRATTDIYVVHPLLWVAYKSTLQMTRGTL